MAAAGLNIGSEKNSKNVSRILYTVPNLLKSIFLMVCFDRSKKEAIITWLLWPTLRLPWRKFSIPSTKTVSMSSSSESGSILVQWSPVWSERANLNMIYGEIRSMSHREWKVLELWIGFKLVKFLFYSFFDDISKFFIRFFQVPEEPRNILVDYGYPCECRGKIFVKGKGEMITYVVKPKNELF